MSNIYTIGHGNRPIEDFVGLLVKYEINFLIDVRSIPKSRFNPHFNKIALSESLASSGIRYLFLGESLGGLPKDPTCYDESGHVLYATVSERDFYLEGIDRLITANSKGIKIACMCSEMNPCDCHRSKLIGETLLSKGIIVSHITKDGATEDQINVMEKARPKNQTDDLFSQPGHLKSRKKYK